MRERIPGLLVGLSLLLSSGISHANVIETFDVSGQFGSPSGGTFSGTLTIDVTDGNAINVDIDVDGVAGAVNPAFYNIISQSDTITDPVTLVLTNGVMSNLLGFSVSFNTANSGSLMGFTGGTIVGGFIQPITATGTFFGATVATGAIGTIPEPATLALLTIGFAGLAAARRRKLT